MVKSCTCINEDKKLNREIDHVLKKYKNRFVKFPVSMSSLPLCNAGIEFRAITKLKAKNEYFVKN